MTSGERPIDEERASHPVGASILLVTGVTLLIVLLSVVSAYR